LEEIICRKNEVKEMIKAKKGKLVVNGYPMELLNEYRVITKEMVKVLESEGFEKEQIKEQLTSIVNMQFMTEEEKKEKIQELTKELFSDITELLDKVLVKEKKEGADNE
jgi:beta-glucosidase-like glycosyl hydrolase